MKLGMLKEDQQMFEQRFPGARNCIRDAQLRKECLILAIREDKTHGGTKRFGVLLKTSACQESWFLVLLSDQMVSGSKEVCRYEA